MSLVVPVSITPQEPSIAWRIQVYASMFLIRRFEEKAGQLYTLGHIGGFCHLYIGQEAVVVGIASALQPGDSLITAYRCHGHMLACGADPLSVMAELTGRSTGCSQGKGGSMHMFAPDKGFYGGHGIVGAQVPLGTGLAFAHAYKQNNHVSVTCMGDGAVNQGQVYESFNMASLWKLPVIYVIENNHYAMGTHYKRACAGDSLYKRGEPFGIPGRQANGMDFDDVYTTMLWAREQASNGPVLIELETYRYRGHSMSDPATYRPRDEVNEMKTRDCLKIIKSKLEASGVSSSELRALEAEIKKKVDEVVAKAMADPQPNLDELHRHVVSGKKD